MALTTGAQAASATPAADQYTLIAAALTAASWTHIHQISAAVAGTTDIVEVWKSPATTVVGAVHTGCILYFEVDNTNARIRVRASEIYDDAAAGTPASRLKFPAAGVAGALITITPSASAAVLDTFGTVLGAGANVGYIEVNTSAAGFDYWLGANANTFVYFSNGGGAINQCVAGKLQYAGDKNTAQGGVAVYILGNGKTITTGTTSWALNSSGSNGSWSTARTSREPGRASTSTIVAFAYAVGGSTWGVTHLSAASVYPSGSPGFPNLFYTHTVMYPAWLHGAAGGGPSSSGTSSGANRANLAPLSEFIVSYSNTNAPGDPTPSQHLTIGDTVTGSDAETYTAMGVTTGGATTTNAGAGGFSTALHVRNSDF